MLNEKGMTSNGFKTKDLEELRKKWTELFNRCIKEEYTITTRKEQLWELLSLLKVPPNPFTKEELDHVTLMGVRNAKGCDLCDGIKDKAKKLRDGLNG